MVLGEAAREAVAREAVTSPYITDTGTLLGFLDGFRGRFFAFRKAPDLLTEKTCDAALNEASNELTTGWYETGRASVVRADAVPEVEMQKTQKDIGFAQQGLTFIPDGRSYVKKTEKISRKGVKETFKGVQPGEFFASSTYV
ncbi:hypothetical protein TWF730_004761 [Orbilia blumenaviensis]|uniref:Uncharacterized protein n=1 Tax=Orbilia blumenaviensis TaxID=1796055 RepID=A0AAV9TYG0_9PEZI